MSEQAPVTVVPIEIQQQVDSSLSAERFHALEGFVESVSAGRPDFAGMTLFGSVARGVATEQSDVDVFIFIKPDIKAPEQNIPGLDPAKHITKVDRGADTGTIEFNPMTFIAYKIGIQQGLSSIGIEKADIIPLPIDDAIIDTAVDELLINARKLNNGDNSSPIVPRNIWGLFNIPVGTSQLGHYRDRVVDRLSKSPHGERAWQMIRMMVLGYERGRNQDHFDSLPHRHIATSLAEQGESETRPNWLAA